MPLKITCMPRPAALAVALLCSVTLPAQAYDQLYVFGDSLSDTGNNGRFTYDGNQHLLYDEALAQRIGAALVASDNGGENYAAGGTVAVPGLNPVDNTQDQVQRYLNRVNGQADGDGLYIHWIGGNDLAAAALNAATAPGVAYNSAAAAAAQVHSLLNAGAGTVIVPTVPNIGSTPQLMELIIQQALPPVQGRRSRRPMPRLIRWRRRTTLHARRRSTRRWPPRRSRAAPFLRCSRRSPRSLSRRMTA